MSHASIAIQPAKQSGFSGRMLVRTVGIIVIGGMLVSVLLPSLCRSSETANRIKCASNLRQLGQAIALYAGDNGGHYPPSLAALVAHEDITAAVMVCPSSSDEASTATDTAAIAELEAAAINAPGYKHCLSYVYVGKDLKTDTASESTVVAYESLDDHDGDGGNALFGDGHVDWIDKTRLKNIADTAGRSDKSPATLH